ncbi:MAG TPA: GNAT family N-acetyltransferase [Anaerolineae bacterium]|nr:GNAT family N-acetyltransferase [Anaerolineae bacterium]
MEIVRATPDDAETLTRICVAAKAYWGYPSEWMERWAPTLRITPEFIEFEQVYVARINDEAVGFYGLICTPPTFILEHLWIEPSHIRQGIGEQLFYHAVNLANEMGAQRIELEAEPNAVGFYEKMGMRRVRDKIGDFERVLPIMELKLATEPSSTSERDSECH